MIRLVGTCFFDVFFGKFCMILDLGFLFYQFFLFPDLCSARLLFGHEESLHVLRLGTVHRTGTRVMTKRFQAPQEWDTMVHIIILPMCLSMNMYSIYVCTCVAFDQKKMIFGG